MRLILDFYFLGHHEVDAMAGTGDGECPSRGLRQHEKIVCCEVATGILAPSFQPPIQRKNLNMREQGISISCGRNYEPTISCSLLLSGGITS